MEKKVKIGVALAAVFVAIGVLLIPAVLAEEEFRESKSTVNQHFPKLPIKFRLRAYILKKGEPTEIDGKIVALEGKILVISNGESLLNINMPGKWIAEGVTYGVHDLLEGDPIGPGDSISINTLKVDIDKDTHSVTMYCAYSITVEDLTASAVLPFNVET